MHFSPGYTKIVKGEGMSLSSDNTKKGDLIIAFDIKFPKQLTPDQKELLSRALND